MTANNSPASSSAEQLASPDIIIADEEEYEVDKLLDDRLAIHGHKKIECRHYLVKWKSAEETEAVLSWEPEENIEPFLIKEYFAMKTRHGRPRAPPPVRKKLKRKVVQTERLAVAQKNAAMICCDFVGCGRQFLSEKGMRQHKTKKHPPATENPLLESSTSQDAVIMQVPVNPEDFFSPQPEQQQMLCDDGTALSGSNEIVEESTSSCEMTTQGTREEQVQVCISPTRSIAETDTSSTSSRSTLLIGSDQEVASLDPGEGQSSMFTSSGNAASNESTESDSSMNDSMETVDMDADGGNLIHLVHIKEEMEDVKVDPEGILYGNWKEAEVAYIKNLKERMQEIQHLLEAQKSLRNKEFHKRLKVEEELEKKTNEIAGLTATVKELTCTNEELRSTNEALRNELSEFQLWKNVLFPVAEQILKFKNSL